MLGNMDPHLLRTFVAVARLASFSEAARELGYTQSAVSQHIAALEQDLGAPLLTRRPVAPPRRVSGCWSTRVRCCCAWTPPAPTCPASRPPRTGA